ncbi:hypothetical protein D0Z07_3574 [Hyphodiscus hymeniophilus]|uniref:Zn(2)-C6 fungal-type domain-containing protein n=1 Tax=Hyphodiscus hymeniophilus TaxID=353542 RepID=A0A9P6VKB5_9HELO|nr:hypothetical protein D0Z07_3574 [Hyphodiscus hymeniophilus]
MAFRGKLSKACERCRTRRLKCDLHTGSCGQCVRANLACSGYRNIQQLRIRNESRVVRLKALRDAPPSEPSSLAVSVDLQARDAFFAYYVTSTSKSWDFLKRYYHPTDTPDHLTLAIEAVSLAYLWHQVHSKATLETARERYVQALRMTNIALKSREEAAQNTTLLASLLLDLFEKITDSKARNQRFQDPAEFRVLVRLTTNYLISCVASSSPVPEQLIAIRTYLGEHLDIQDPKWRLSDLMVLYADLLSDIRRGILSDRECIARCEELDFRLEKLNLEMPASWQASTTFLDAKSERAFDFRVDSYVDRNVTQARNVLRSVRILLNESLLELYAESNTDENVLTLRKKIYLDIEILTTEICASVTQYVDCDGAARMKLPTSKTWMESGSHPHTPKHVLECYTLLFPLYVVGHSSFASCAVRQWAVTQLYFISEHFCIRNAEIVAQILKDGKDTNPWDVYTTLGSYAFAA